MKPSRIALGGALLGAAGLIVLVALPRETSPEAPAAAPVATITTQADGRRAGVVVAPEARGDPTLGGVCLVFDADRAREAHAAWRARGAPVARGTLTIRGERSVSTWELRLTRGEYRLCLPTPGLTQEAASAIGLSWSEGEPPTLDRVEPLRLEAGDPIPADLGVILQYRRDRWRSPRFEVFRWSGLPSILVFDTAGYDVQDRFFKRLAFYVEKTGWAGTIPDFESIAELHGFNAHDYRAEDLARFYRFAASTGTALLEEEIELRDILLHAGVIRRTDTGYAAGEGGVLSISRGSNATLRERFLTHEALHGLYFTSPGFRGGVERVWRSTTEDVREFFRLYLAWPDWGYDVTNTYLLMNEFMSYLLQYTAAEARSELFVAGTRWLDERYPRRSSWIEAFRADGGTAMDRAHRALEEELWDALGATGGDLIRLGPVSPP